MYLKPIVRGVVLAACTTTGVALAAATAQAAPLQPNYCVATPTFNRQVGSATCQSGPEKGNFAYSAGVGSDATATGGSNRALAQGGSTAAAVGTGNTVFAGNGSTASASGIDNVAIARNQAIGAAVGEDVVAIADDGALTSSTDERSFSRARGSDCVLIVYGSDFRASCGYPIF